MTVFFNPMDIWDKIWYFFILTR